MTAAFCRAAADRKAATWQGLLAPFPRLELAHSDAAKGITAAVAQRAAARRHDPSAPPLEHGLDVFHTAMEAHRALARHWRRAEAAWEEAEGADAELAGAKRQGIDARGPVHAARAAWRRAVAALKEAERLEAAWGRAAAALESFETDGRLNDRIRAEAAIAAALEDLTGPGWSEVRNFLADPRSLTFLDRMHRRRGAAEPRAEWREAMAWRWRPQPQSGPRSRTGPGRSRQRSARRDEGGESVPSSPRETVVKRRGGAVTPGVRGRRTTRPHAVRRSGGDFRRRDLAMTGRAGESSTHGCNLNRKIPYIPTTLLYPGFSLLVKSIGEESGENDASESGGTGDGHRRGSTARRPSSAWDE
jgi:hypothetical protein